jgi:hypothetical protein
VKSGFRAPIRVLRAYIGLFDQPGTKGFVAAGFISRLTSSMVCKHSGSRFLSCVG